MTSIIDVLKARYKKKNLELLTPLQQKFLLDREVAEHTDGGGSRTVSIVSIEQNDGHTILTIQDMFEFMNQKTNPGKITYQISRIERYSRILGVETNSWKSSGNTFTVILPDGSIIVSKILVYKDRAY